jgi:hypothetical protein
VIGSGYYDDEYVRVDGEWIPISPLAGYEPLQLRL